MCFFFLLMFYSVPPRIVETWPTHSFPKSILWICLIFNEMEGRLFSPLMQTRKQQQIILPKNGQHFCVLIVEAFTEY